MENKLKVLIIDDEPDLLELCSEAFECDGHLPTCAASGCDALTLLGEEKFDAIVSDSRMPEMTGEQFLKAAKEKLGDDLPPFFLSTGAMDVDVEGLSLLGMTALIIKPFDVEEMVELVVSKALALEKD